MNRDFWPFVKKETLHIIRDVRTMIVVLLIPVILMILFGFAISTDINNINVSVVSPVRSNVVRAAVDRLAHNPYFTVIDYIDDTEIDKVLRTGEADVVVVFNRNYDKLVQQQTAGEVKESAIQLILDASNTNVATSASNYLSNILMPEMNRGTAVAQSPQSLFETHLLFNPQMKTSYNFVSGIMGLIFILICAMMTSVSIVKEKELGTMEVLLVSPVQPIKIILAKMIPYFVLSCMNLATILAISRLLLDVPMSGGILNIVLVSLLYLVLALALGLLISTISDSQITALLISAVVMLMPIMMLSGMVFPIENMPQPLQWVSCIIPARWYISAMRKLMIEGLPLEDIITEVLVLVVMTIAIITVALKKFNDRLE